MFFRLSCTATFWLIAFGLLPSLTQSATPDLQVEFGDRIRPLLEAYCLDCHDADVQKGDLDLSGFNSLAAIQADFQTWQVVLQQVEEEEMPPKKPLPSDGERAELAEWVRGAMNAIDWSKHRGIGRVTLPRLTKTEYNNTLNDLLGVDFRPGDQLLDDGQGMSGFTNDRDGLFISPALAEQYFDAGDYALQAVLNLARKVGDTHFEAEEMLMTERGSKPEDLPGGGVGYSLAGAGQRTLYDEFMIPADGWYRFTVRAVGRGGDSGVRLRIDNEARHDFYLRDDVPESQSVDLLLRAGTHQMTWNIELPPALKEVQRMATEAAKELKAKQRRLPKALPLPDDPADLVRTAAKENAPQLPVPKGASDEVAKLVGVLNRNFINMQMRVEYLRLLTPSGDPNQLRTYYGLLPERTKQMVGMKKQLATAMGVATEEIDRQLREADPEKLADNEKLLAASMEMIGLEYVEGFSVGAAFPKAPIRVGSPGVDWIEISGPILPDGADAERVAELFQKDAKAALRAFLPRAFRRPLRTGELSRHVKLYETAVERGEPHDQALKLAFTAALTSPHFLFRDEAGTEGAEFLLNDHQLANRLSYFLWMTMPDAELRALADAGKLRDNATLKAQVRRMVADPKARAFTESFLGQWLGFAGLGSEHVPDEKKFREFTPTLAEAMKLEPVLVFEQLMREGGSLLELLDGKQTFANAELAAIYEMQEVAGDELQPVKLSDDRRGGLLGMAAILTASSTPNRTSPVIRGTWVLENLLGRHLAEPPADAGQLSDKAGEARGKTLREELAEHRRNESCAGCHDKIDPIGFGLENFDAIGRFRDLEAGKPVDASGELPGGVEFTGPQEMRTLLRERHAEEFVSNLTRRLSAFALGRALRPQDEGLVRELVADLKAHGYRADQLVEEIVLSDAFRTQGGTR